jgi:poly-beta-1,6-N-acetyl-D-glucosamine synthase
MRVTLFVPCYNEEKSIEKSVESWLAQTRPADEIIVVDDSSTDNTPQILEKFKDRIKIVRTPGNTGNKSYAQEFGLGFVTGDIMVTTDGDTLLDKNFIEEIIKEFEDPEVAAACGYIKSLKYNWLTLCRAFEYSISQNLHKLAQSYVNFLFVISGAAGAFRTEIFKNHISFDHDTITEDLDFTYKLHRQGFKISYSKTAIVYTQDPSDLRSYKNQMRRWYGGGWQNLLKHWRTVKSPSGALELSLIYIEGFIFPFLLFIVPFLNLLFAAAFAASYILLSFLLSIYAAKKEKRPDILLAPLPCFFLMYVNAYILFEQFLKEVIFKKKNLIWVKPERVQI